MKGNKLIDDHVQIAVNLVKYKKAGKTFEVSVDPDKIVEFREGVALDIDEIVNDSKIFIDMKKGLVASEAELEEGFGTNESEKILQIMIEEGEVQFTQKYRDELRERKFNKLVNLIHLNAVDPKTGIPHPETRIRSGLEEAKFKINDLEKAENQVDNAIKVLRPIMPISLEKVLLEVIVPTQFAGALHGKITTFGKIKQENWLNDGGLHTVVELPAGLQNKFIDMLNNASHGGCTVEIKERIKN
ncbi:ribosome assembly factor SBDS [Candidatus Woesearchaeota archaeon]|nr:ribosome assembly factor SBDS [Candidatus Woesearchaeota archaeon]